MDEDRIPVLIPQGPSREIDENRVSMAYTENDEGFYIIGGSRKPDVDEMGDYFPKKVSDKRIKIFDDAVSYADFFYKSQSFIDGKFYQVATNKTGLRRFRLYLEKSKEGNLSRDTKMGRIIVNESKITRFKDWAGLISDKWAFSKVSFEKGLARKISPRKFGYDWRKFGE